MDSRIRHLRRLSQQAIVPLLIFAIVGYFVYHSVQGERGVLALLKMRNQLALKKAELAVVQGERNTLEEMVNCLRPESINRDLLERQVRLVLGYTHPDDIVILTLEDPSRSQK